MHRLTAALLLSLGCLGLPARAMAQVPMGTVTCSAYSAGKSKCTSTVLIGRDTVVKTITKTKHDTIPRVPLPAVHDTVTFYCVMAPTLSCSTTKPVPAPPVVTPPAPPAPPPAPPPVVTPPAPPPSVGHPLFVTAAMRQSWAVFKTSGHPWYGLVQGNCAKSGSSAARYGDDGTWCGLLALYEGDTTAARKAIALELHVALIPPDPNTERQACGERIVLADWLYPLMTQAQRDSVLTLLSSWVRWGLRGTGVNYVGGFRTDDGDQSTATYLCAALLDRYTRGTSQATHWLDSTMTAPGLVAVKLGNLGAGAGTERANLARYASMCAAGGEWSESTEYNPNTTKLLALGYLALRAADGVDSLPDVRACLTADAERIRWELTPDLLQGDQWGDEEHPRDFLGRLYERVGIAAILAAAADSSTAPFAQGVVNKLVAKYGTVGYNTAEPIVDGGWYLGLFNPGAPADTTSPIGAHLATGRGHLWVRNATSLFFGQAEQPTGEDHQVGYVHNLQLYRQGEWVLDAPTGYLDPFNKAGAQNGVVYAGFAAMAQKGFVAADSSAGRRCITGSTSGGLYAAGYYQPPGTFLSIGLRTSCYTQVNGVDVVIVRDSVAITKPTVLNRYRAADLAQLDTTGGWYQVWHPQSVPTRAGNTWTWTTAKGQTVQLTAFASSVTADPLLDEHAMPYPGAATNPTMHYQLHLRTPDPVLTTVVVIGSALPVSVTGKVVTVGGVTIVIP